MATTTDDAVVEKEVLNSKMFLKKTPCHNVQAGNLYDCLANILTEVLTERPADAVGILGAYLNNAHSNSKESANCHMDVMQKPVIPKMQLKLFKNLLNSDNNDGSDTEQNFEVSLPNCLHLGYLYEQAGIGIGREDMFRLFLAIKQLTRDYVLVKVRFWGKMFGVEKDYYIIEAEFPNEEEEFVEDANPETPEQPVDFGLLNGPAEVDDLPKSTWQPPPPIPAEPHHTGTNKNVYFVCNVIGEPWIKLPHVTPEEISVSRKISKLLTGNLDDSVLASPLFDGKEANYLRALIARISASTQIAPSGYYTFGDDDDDDDDEELKEGFSINPEYTGLSIAELTDSLMTGWVHITPYILPQGRCRWFDPAIRLDNNLEEDEFEDEYETERNTAAETGPKLLSTVADDKGVQSNPAWSTSTSSLVLPRHAVAVARSVTWPGAFAVAQDNMFENVYVGWGRKYNADCYTPERPGPTGDEYPYGPEVTEIEDPDVETERAMKAKELAAMRAADDLEENQHDDEDED